jgi:hypothetical protein
MATKWTSQFFSGPFADFGLKLVKNTRRRYPNDSTGNVFTGSFIFGVDVTECPKGEAMFDNQSISSDTLLGE